MGLKKWRLVAAALFVASAQFVPVANASSQCPFLATQEAGMIERRVLFYIELLEKNDKYDDTKGAAFWNHKIASSRTLKEYQSQLTPSQLKALSQSGCKAEQGALLTMQVELIVGAKVVEIFDAVLSKEDAREKLVRLSVLPKLSDISRSSSEKK